MLFAVIHFIILSFIIFALIWFILLRNSVKSRIAVYTRRLEKFSDFRLFLKLEKGIIIEIATSAVAAYAMSTFPATDYVMGLA